MDKNLKRRLGLIFFVVPMLFVVPILGVAAGLNSGHSSHELPALVDIDGVVVAATAEQPGRFVRAELHQEASGYVYRVVLEGGSAVQHTLHFDARTGRPLS